MALQRPEPAPAVQNTVDHDIAAGRDAARLGKGDIIGIGVRNMKAEMGDGVFVSPVDFIGAFGGPFVAFVGFVAFGVATHGDGVSADGRTVALQGELSVAFIDKNGIGLLVRGSHGGRRAGPGAEHDLRIG